MPHLGITAREKALPEEEQIKAPPVRTGAPLSKFEFQRPHTDAASSNPDAGTAEAGAARATPSHSY